MKCKDCKATIPAKRLAAMPHAEYCVECQPYHHQKRQPPAHVMAELSEPDDVTRIREEGWLNV